MQLQEKVGLRWNALRCLREDSHRRETSSKWDGIHLVQAPFIWTLQKVKSNLFAATEKLKEMKCVVCDEISTIYGLTELLRKNKRILLLQTFMLSSLEI